MKKILPIYNTPIIGYMEDVHPLSVLLTCKRTFEWFYMNYIQLSFQDPKIFINQPLKFFKPDLSTGDVWTATNSWIKYETITKDMIYCFSYKISDFIKYAVNQNKYITINLDEFYVSYRMQYHNTHYIHDTFINGYDDEKNIFYGIAYVGDPPIYKEFTVKMSEVEEAFYHNNSPYFNTRTVKMLSIDLTKFYEFNITNFVKQIRNYIECVNLKEKYYEEINVYENENMGFGLDIYNKLIDYMEEYKENTAVALFQVLIEHKKVMIDRLKFLEVNQYANNLGIYMEEYEELLEIAQSIKMSFLKYLKRRNQIILQGIYNRFKVMRDKEKKILTDLITRLQEDNNEKHVMYSSSGNPFYLKRDFILKQKNENRICISIRCINWLSMGVIKVTNNRRLIENRQDALLTIEFSLEENYIDLFVVNVSKRIENFFKPDCVDYTFEIVIDQKNSKVIYSIQSDNDKVEIEFNDIILDEYKTLLLQHINSYKYKINNIIID